MSPEHVPQVTPKPELTLIAPPKPNSESVPIPAGRSKRRWWLREGSETVVTIYPSSRAGSRGACSCLRWCASVALLVGRLEVLLAESCDACLLLLHLRLLLRDLLCLEALELFELCLDGRCLRLQQLLLLEE